jgi:hypothetical protein
MWHLFCQLKEGGGFQADKVGQQFSGSTTSKKQTFQNQHFQRSVALLDILVMRRLA